MAGSLIVWFLHDIISETRESIKDVDKTVKVISKDLFETQKHIVKIQTDIEYMKTDKTKERIKSDEFENKVATILRESKGRFLK